MAVHASAVEVSLREINANLAELRREVARMSMRMDNWDKQVTPLINLCLAFKSNN